MRRTIFIIPLFFIVSCCTIKETDEQTQKKIFDLTTSNSLLRVREAQKDSTIAAYQDSLWKCREDSRIVK